MSAAIRVIAAFATSFGSVLYDTGYADTVRDAGMCDAAASERDMVRALAYVHGYADACRLASPYHGRHWRVAHLMSIMTGVLSAMLEAGDSSDEIGRRCDSYVCELIAEAAMVDA